MFGFGKEKEKEVINDIPETEELIQIKEISNLESANKWLRENQNKEIISVETHRSWSEYSSQHVYSVIIVYKPNKIINVG